MNREICGQCGQSLDPNWIDERIPKLESMLREAIRERDSLRQHLHDEHQRHVNTMDERDTALADLAAARARNKECDLLLSRVLHELAGSASLCWEPKPTGVFATELALGFVEDAIKELRAALAGERREGE